MSTQQYAFSFLLFYAYICFVKSATKTGSNFICDTTQGCKDDIIICDANKTCTIACTGTDGCRSAQILCPNKANCTINCAESAGACRQSTINATASTSLSIDCLQSRVCQRTNIYCPNNGHSGPISCNVYTEPGTAYLGISIYAVEGFNDVVVTGDPGTLSSIYCTETYQTQCTLNNSGPAPYQCASCQNILIPTAMPTKTPSVSPTEIPSNYPTNIPTFIPTAEPTIEPSMNPTIEPSITTNYPSTLPTKTPTIYPTPSPTIILGIRDPTISPSFPQSGVDTTSALSKTSNDNSSLEQNEGAFSKTSNLIILILSAVAFLLVVIVGILMCRKYKHRRKGTDDPETIVIQMNSSDKVNTKPKDVFAMQSASIYSVSDKDNVDTEMLMDLNLDEGADENGKNVLMVQETQQYDINKHELKKDDSLSRNSDANVQYKNNEFIMEEKDISEDSEEIIMQGLTDVGDVIVNTLQEVEQKDSDMVGQVELQLINSMNDNEDDVVMIGITNDGNDEKQQNDDSLNINDLEENDLIDMGGLTDIGDLVVGL